MARVVIQKRCSSSEFVTELHYRDGDVGPYDDIDVHALWALFTKGHSPSHILIRPNTEEGQILSNRLHAAAGEEGTALRSTSKRRS